MKKNIILSLAILGFMWLVWLIDVILPFDLTHFGILPRHLSGLPGVVLSPFLHAGFTHLISNSLPILVLTFVLLTFYENLFLPVYTFSILIGGILVWILARSAYHVGASGLIYSLVGFLVASGIFQRKFKALIIAIIIVFLYGGLIWGVLPVQPWISWEGHLFGLIAGVFLAYLYRNRETNSSSTI